MSDLREGMHITCAWRVACGRTLHGRTREGQDGYQGHQGAYGACANHWRRAQVARGLCARVITAAVSTKSGAQVCLNTQLARHHTHSMPPECARGWRVKLCGAIACVVWIRFFPSSFQMVSIGGGSSV